jgi:translation initiation factor eIF-2B subunit epsilon
LAALYQDDMIDEDDIRAWHAQPDAKGEGMFEGEHREKVRKLWLVGARMIHQLNEQESDDEDNDDGSEEEEDSE